MLHLLIAALVLTWRGVGLTEPPPVVPVIVSRLALGRLPSRPVVLQAYEGRERVVAEYSVTPADAILFSAKDPQGWPEYAMDSYAIPGKYRGPATIHGRYRHDTDRLQAFVYDSVYVNCYAGVASDGVRFDADGVARTVGTPAESDIYEMGPANSPEMDIHRGCTGAFIDPTQTTGPIHVPYGGTIVTNTYFGDISVRAWRNDFTILPQLHAGDALLFKTKDGRVVKVLVYSEDLAGAYITGPPRGDFLDYVTWHPKRKHSR